MNELMYIQGEPSPHVVLDGFFADELYRRALDAFPATEAQKGGRTGRDLLPGDPGYLDIIRAEPWQEVHAHLTHPSFVQTLLSSFSTAMREHGCRVDADDYDLTPFVERRESLQSAVLDPRAPPRSLFVRVDFQEAGPGYTRGVHLDHRRRIVSGLIFFSDAESQSMSGGRFVLHGAARTAALRVRVAPKHNRAVFFLGCNDSFHEATLLESCRGTRRWLYYSVSSKVDVW